MFPRTGKEGALPAAVVATLAALSVLTRLPFYADSVIEWDESTFVVIAQRLLDGYLPYVDLWDNKPPLTFVFYAVVLGVWHSLIAVRVAGTVWLFLASLLTWRIGCLLWDRTAAFASAALVIVCTSLLPPYGMPAERIFGGQATLTEILALVPMLAALLLLMPGARDGKRACLAGVALSAATLFRSNLAFVTLAVGVSLVALSARMGVRGVLRQVGAYVCGGLVPLGLVLLPYVVSGHLREFVEATLVAPAAYVQSFSQSDFVGMLRMGFDRSNVVLWGGAIAGLVASAMQCWRADRTGRRAYLLLGVFTVATAWSIASSGSAYVHYLVQIIPFLALLAGAAVASVARLSKVAAAVVLALGLLAPVGPLVERYRAAATTLAEGRPLRSDAGYQIAAYLSANNPLGRPVYLMSDHIAYWLIGMPPIAPSVTHPSTISKEYFLEFVAGPGATSDGELAKILAREPEFIVTAEFRAYLKGHAAERLAHALARDYEEAFALDRRHVYRRVHR
jgi:hypothetical protein